MTICGGPEEAPKLAGAGHDSHVMRLAASTHPTVDAGKALLGAVGDREHVLGLTLLTVGERRPEPGRTAVVPGGLDQQPTGEHRTGLGDRTLAGALAGLAEQWCQSEPCRERRCALEAFPVPAELEMDRERCQGVHTAEGPEPCDRGPPPLIACQR